MANRRRCSCLSVDACVRCPDFCWFGALSSTQLVDLVDGCALVVETSLDLRGAGCAAQSNIRAFYAYACALRCVKWILERGFGAALCAATLPSSVDAALSGGSCRMRGAHRQARRRDFDWQSQGPGVLGRILVLDAFVEPHPHWFPCGSTLADGRATPRVVLRAAAHADDIHFRRPDRRERRGAS